ncbi:MAG: ribokinase [Candidatus Omnitrophica bacterium]|nr:ribokinase [Candidatus Omnitrophota bacterium]
MKEKAGPIIVIGSLNVDIVARLSRIPAPGETLFCQTYRMVAGGKGANQAAAVARLGGRAMMVGKVGQDFFGRFLIEKLNQAGVDTRFVRRERKSPTGLALIWVNQIGENSIVVVGGANQTLTEKEIDCLQPFIKRAAIVLLQLEIPLKTVCHTIRLANKFSVPVVLDPGPASPLPPGIFPLISFILPNEP